LPLEVYKVLEYHNILGVLANRTMGDVEAAYVSRFQKSLISAQIALVLEYIQASNATHVAPGLLDQLKALEAHCKTVAILLEDQNSRNWNLGT